MRMGHRRHYSISRRLHELGLSFLTLLRLLPLESHLHPYKVQLTNEFHPTEHTQHHTHLNWVLEQQRVDGDFSDEILFNTFLTRWIPL